MDLREGNQEFGCELTFRRRIKSRLPFAGIIRRLSYSTRLWYNAPTMLPAGSRQHRGCIIPQAVTHSLVLLKMGKIIARNMLS